MKKLTTSSLALLFLFACGGEDNPAVTPDPDAGGNNPTPDAAVQPPPPPPPQNITVTGRVTKLGSYLAGTTEYVGEAAVLALGVSPAKSDVSVVDGVTGAYTLELPANGQLVFYANKANYYPTYTPVTVQQANIDNQKVYLTEVDWLDAITTAHNIDLNAQFACHAPALDPNYQCIYGVVLGRILDDGTAGNGTLRPVGGVSATDFTVTGGAAGADWYVKGPYFLDTDGTPNAANTASVVVNNGNNYDGGLYVTFVEVPVVNGPDASNIQLSVAYTDPDTGVNRQFGPQSVQVYRLNGVTWSNIKETGVVPPPPPGPVDFDTQIYPLLLPTNQGGYGCQGCHTDQGGATPAGGMNLYGGPDVAYAALDPANYPQRVNVAAPAASYLLTKPLYEDNGVQNHPIFAFASSYDPAYQLIYRWITEGGKRDVVLDAVSFRTQIRPLLYAAPADGGAGCIVCHGGDPAAAPGGFYVGGTPEELYAELTAEAPADNGGTGEAYRINKDTPANSLVLTNPLIDHPEPHGFKVFTSNLDARYQLIYRWIQEGYVLDDAQ